MTKPKRKVAATSGDVDPSLDEAIEWKLLLDSGDATEADHQGLQTWRQRSGANEAAWASLSDALAAFGAARRLPVKRGTFARIVRTRAIGRRNAVLGMFAAGIAGAAAATISDRYVPLGSIAADAFTWTGERRSIVLEDGSDLVLGARSAVDFHVTGSQRLLNLLDGEVTLKSVEAETPFVARTGELTMVADKGWFVLRKRNGQSSITAIDQPAQVSPRKDVSIILKAGFCITHNGPVLTQMPAEVKMEKSLIDGLLVVENHTLASVIEGLRPYFAGIIRVDPAVSGLRVTGVYHLSDPPRTIRLIAAALNLSVDFETSYWISIGARTSI